MIFLPRRKSSITLIEILLVISLLALVVGSLQFGVVRMLQELAFVQKVSQVREAIALAQEMMIDTRADLTLTLYHQDKKLFLELHSTKLLPQKLSTLVERIECCKVEALSFNGKTTQELLLNFEGHLGRMSQGEILIEGRGEKKEKITLRGYPGRVS